MPQRDAQRLDIARKSRFTPPTRSAVHSGPPIRMKSGLNTTSCGYHLYTIHDLEFCDSVRLGPGESSARQAREFGRGRRAGALRGRNSPRPAAAPDPEELALMRLIDEQYLAAPFYGSRRMTAALRLASSRRLVFLLICLLLLATWSRLHLALVLFSGSASPSGGQSA